jgi:hypothetical protein
MFCEECGHEHQATTAYIGGKEVMLTNPAWESGDFEVNHNWGRWIAWDARAQVSHVCATKQEAIAWCKQRMRKSLRERLRSVE